MGSPTGFWRLQPGSLGLLRYLLRPISGAHGQTEKIRHLVST